MPRRRKHNGKAGVSWDGPRGSLASAGSSGRAGISWTAPGFSSVLIALALVLTVLVPAPTLADDSVDVIVRAAPGTAADVAVLIEDAGGSVTAELGIIDGFAAELPNSAIDRLASDPAVVSVVPDGTVELTGWHYASDDQEAMASVADKVVEADQFWNDGYTGAGVDIALIDSGVSPVDGLTVSNKVINGPDLSFESQDPDLRYLDSFGHGTHLAGIMAGQADSTPSRITTKEAKRHFLGIAPDARIVNVKVATRNGATDVSQVIAALDWVVQHRNDNGMNIRVINLSFGTDSSQSYILDPLAFAVEQAWNHGIVVVVAAGNDGNNSPLRNPASDPFVIAVGAAVVNSTARTSDDSIPTFSSCGTNERHVDVVAPGRSIVSLLAPGSAAAVDHPEAIVDGSYIVGSGTSQAAAVVSGAAALIIDQRPGISPDEVKALLMETAESIRGERPACQGAGLINLSAALRAATPDADQSASFAPSLGTGSLEASRGSFNLSHDGVILEGEQDIMGSAWDGASWSSLSASGASWSGGDWNGASWSGASWSGMSWSGMSWSASAWLGLSWGGPALLIV